MTTIASKITILTIVYSFADQRKHQSSASLAFVRGIHRRPVNSRTKGQERGKCFHLMTSSWNDSNCICVGLVDGWAAWWPTSVRNLAAVVLWRECYGVSYPGGRLNIKVSSYKYRDPQVNTLRPRRNEQHFADDTLKRIFFNENVWISIKISLKYVPRGTKNNIRALVQIMAWRRSGDKPLSEPIMVSLPTHICVTRPQWVKDKTVSRPSYL